MAAMVVEDVAGWTCGGQDWSEEVRDVRRRARMARSRCIVHQPGRSEVEDLIMQDIP